MRLRSSLAGLAAVMLSLVSNAAVDSPSDLHEKGRAVYNFRCYFCHGYSGDARTLASTYLTPRPADFTRADSALLTVSAVAAVLEHGRPATAMKSFSGILSKEEIRQVAEFVVLEFVHAKAVNTLYHTLENGWPAHDRYKSAFPFARGDIALTQALDTLTAEQVRGRHLYFSSCVTCHDRGAPVDDPVVWEARPATQTLDNARPAKPLSRRQVKP